MMALRACVVSQHFYPGDARLSREIQALQESGYSVDVVCMGTADQSRTDTGESLNIYRIRSLPRKRAGKLRYVLEYATFFIPAFFLLTLLHLRKHYALVHVTNLPDALLFAALIPKLLGARVIFDIRECTPEMFEDRFGVSRDSFLMRVMTAIEQRCIRFADATVTCTEQMRQAVIARGADPSKVRVMLNVSSMGIGSSELPPVDSEAPADDSFRIITHGTIIKRYGHEVLIKAMALVRQEVPRAHLNILGRGQAQPELEELVHSLGLEQAVTFRGHVPQSELVALLCASHCGIVPIIRNVESDLVHTHKMFEYIELGIPVICTRTSAVQAYFDESCLYFFESADERDLANAIVDLYTHPVKRETLAQNASRLLEQYSPAKQRAVYAELVEQLVQPSLDQRELSVQTDH